MSQVAKDRAREFASIGGGHAANALAKLLECTVMMDPPRCWPVEVPDLSSSFTPRRDWGVSVFVDIVGATTGQAGIVLTSGAVEEVLTRLMGDDHVGDLDERACSALSEVGNIALSAAASAFGDLVGGVVVPSVPRLGFDMDESFQMEGLRRALHPEPAYLAETELAERDGMIRVRFVWIPTD